MGKDINEFASVSEGHVVVDGLWVERGDEASKPWVSYHRDKEINGPCLGHSPAMEIKSTVEQIFCKRAQEACRPKQCWKGAVVQMREDQRKDFSGQFVNARGHGCRQARSSMAITGLRVTGAHGSRTCVSHV